jgi:hypothetical protein
MTTYRFSKEYLLLFVLGLVFFTWISLPPYYSSRGYGMILIGLLFWFKFLTTPYRVHLINDQILIAQSLIQSQHVALADVDHIRESMMSVRIVYKEGQITLSTLMKGIHELKRTIKTFDRQIEIQDVEQEQFKRYEKNPLKPLISVILLILFLLATKFFF